MFSSWVEDAHAAVETGFALSRKRTSSWIVLEKFKMNAKELAEKFNAKTDAAVLERQRQSGLATEHIQKRSEDIEHCKRAMECNVLPFLAELKELLGDSQFTFAPQIDMHDHKPVGVSFKIGDGGTTSISTALGNIIVTRLGDGGTKKGIAYVYPPDAEPFISNSGDLTRDKIAKLVEMVIDNT
jgi:hypothetical protein